MFIALEGQDSTGKSTLRNVLSERLGAVPYSTPPPEYLSRRTQIDKTASAQKHYEFYLEGTQAASDEIGELIKNGRSVVCDRYWLTTYIYHQVMGANVHIDDFKFIIRPALTVILSLNHETQMARMSARGITAGDARMMSRQQELTAEFYKSALAFKIPFLVIDTLQFSPEDCANIIVAAIESSLTH